MTPQEAIEAAELMEAEAAYRNQLGREMYAGRVRRGGDGHGRRVEPDRPGGCLSPPHAELEEKRWGPGGREAFGRPRPGDFPGRQPRPEPEAEPELEIA